MSKNKKFSYDDKSNIIDNELKKRRGKWFLTSLAWLDFEDVSQIIRAHIFQKWDHWDQERALEPWVNKIISNQLKNILRNYYSNFVRPCLNCPFNNSLDRHGQSAGSGDNLCGFTRSGTQCGECPLYAKWEKTKKAAYDIKMAIAIESETKQVRKLESNSFDIDLAEQKLHVAMEKTLPEKQFYIYKLLFIKNLDEEHVAKILGYKSNERGRKAGYKQIKNLKKKFKEKAIEVLNSSDICP